MRSKSKLLVEQLDQKLKAFQQSGQDFIGSEVSKQPSKIKIIESKIEISQSLQKSLINQMF